jgi:hypothetical protein
MDVTSVAAVFSALGLSGAAGLNAFIPLLLVAVGGRLGWLTLEPPFDTLSSTPLIAALSLLLAFEMVVDKIPGADHLNDFVQSLIRPAAGALLVLAQAGVLGHLHPYLALTSGVILAFSVHATKAAVRPAVTASTLGIGTPFVSAAEDALSLLTSLLAIFLPLIAAAFVLLTFALGIWMWRRRARVHSQHQLPR